MSITIKQLAKITGYSVSTVSKALNTDPAVNPKTRKKIQSIADKLGYTPNILAKNLVQKKTNSFGLIITDITNPFFSEFTTSVEKRAREHGYSVILSITNNDDKLEKEYVQEFRELRVAGMIIIPSYEKNADRMHLWKLRNDNFPFVINRKITGLDANIVCVDYFKSFYENTKYLIKLGHTNIGFISQTSTEGVLEGYEKALAEYGIYLNRDLIFETGPSFTDAFEALEDLCAMQDLPSAIVTGNDVIAMSAIKVFNKYDINVPGDISIVSFDDIQFAELTQVHLTTRAQPIKKLGANSVDMLLEMLEYPEEKAKQLILNTDFKVRDSCRSLLN